MGKTLKIGIIVLLLAAIVGYTALWFVKKGEIEEQLASIIPASPVTIDDVSLSYENYKVGGFPFSYTVEFEDVALEASSFQMPVSRMECDELTAKFPLFSAKIELDFCDEMTGMYPALEEDVDNLTKTDLEVTIGLKKALWKTVLFGDALPTDLDTLIENEVKYIAVDADKLDSYINNEKVSKIGGIDVFVDLGFEKAVSGTPGSYTIRYAIEDMEIIDEEKYLSAMGLYSDLGSDFEALNTLMTNILNTDILPSTLVFDMEMDVKEGGENIFKLNDFTLENDEYAFHIDGKATRANAFSVPSGSANVRMDDYADFITAIQSFYGVIADLPNSSPALFSEEELNGLRSLPVFSQELAGSIVQLLEQIGDVDGDDLAFTVSMENGQPPQIGKLNAMQAMLALNQVMESAAQ